MIHSLFALLIFIWLTFFCTCSFQGKFPYAIFFGSLAGSTVFLIVILVIVQWKRYCKCDNIIVVFICGIILQWRHSGLMVSLLLSGSSGLGSSPVQEHCVVFLGKTRDSHSASLYPGVKLGTDKFIAGWYPCDGLTSHPGGGE